MEIIKKNIVSIIFALIAIAAMVAAFYPMSGNFEKLNQELADRKTKFQQAKAIAEKQRELPVVNVGENNAERTPLGIFPMPSITKMAAGYMDKLVSQSQGVFVAAMQINQWECRMDDKGGDVLEAVAAQFPVELARQADDVLFVRAGVAAVQPLRLLRVEDIGEWPLAYLNRLSDLLFVLSRWIGHHLGESEFLWERPLRREAELRARRKR